MLVSSVTIFHFHGTRVRLETDNLHVLPWIGNCLRIHVQISQTVLKFLGKILREGQLNPPPNP